MQTFFNTLTTVFAYICAVTLALLVVLITYDAMMRYVLHEGSIALQELEWHLFDVVILLSIAYTLQKNAHVRVDIFYDNFSDTLKHIINIISVIFFITPFSLLIIYISYDFVLMSFTQMEASSNPGGLEYRFVVKSLMPMAFVLVLLQSLVNIINDIKALRV